jgi:dTDP-4-amino-4,6-dideoxygalactose transaminase
VPAAFCFEQVDFISRKIITWCSILIPFNKPFIAGKELLYISQAVMENSQLAGDGYFSRKCQAWLEEKLSCMKALLTHSCTGALEMAAILCDLKAGDEVIMPSFTFVSTANSFVLRGAVPVFIDIRPDTLNIDENLIEQAITERTKAIVAVHYAGTPCAMSQIMSIAEKHSLYVIEDAAQSLSSRYKGKSLGTIGHFGTLSFHETKNVISGEGGALLINDNRFVERAEVIWEKGTNRKQYFRGDTDKYTWVDIGSSFLPSELIAAFLYAQFEESETIISKRNRICDLYQEYLTPLERQGRLRLPVHEIHAEGNGHIFYITTGSIDERNSLISYLKERNVHAVFHYVPLHSSPGGRKYARTSGSLPITDDISSRVLRLPLYYEMTEEQVQRTSRYIHDYYDSIDNRGF